VTFSSCSTIYRTISNEESEPARARLGFRGAYAQQPNGRRDGVVEERPHCPQAIKRRAPVTIFRTAPHPIAWMFLDVQLRHAHRSVAHRPENCRSPSVIQIAPKMVESRCGAVG
jgi:hypothetical protein